MPRYLIHRRFSTTENEMPRIGRRSKELCVGEFTNVVWEHSHVVVDDDGMAGTYCVYEAPDEETVRRHAVALGEHDYSIREIVADVTPDDFPLERDAAV
jgi:hypothetical protein